MSKCSYHGATSRSERKREKESLNGRRERKKERERGREKKVHEALIGLVLGCTHSTNLVTDGLVILLFNLEMLHEIINIKIYQIVLESI